MNLVKAGAAYFGLVFAAGFLLGALRVLLVVPQIGVRAAELAEMPAMLVVILLAARFVVRRFALPGALGPRLTVGTLALALLLAAELGLATVLQDQSIAAYIAGRDPVSGSVYLVMLLVYAAMPAVLARFRNRSAGD